MTSAPYDAALGDPRLRSHYGRVRGPFAFVDESYRSPSQNGPGFYTMTGSVIAHNRLIPTRRALLHVAGRSWHTNEIITTSPERIHRMNQVIASQTDNNTLIVSTPWESGSSASHRNACLETLVPELVRQGAQMVVLDASDEATETRDKRLVHALRADGTVPRHTQATHSTDDAEPLLWIADTIGWDFHRLVHTNQAEWTRDIGDVVAIKESTRAGWVDLGAMRAAAIAGVSAKSNLNVQATHLAEHAPEPTWRRPPRGRHNEGPTRM